MAIERNATHGLQLSQQDKRDMARKIYHVTPDKERDAKKKQLAKILSVSERTVRDWLSRIDKDSREARNKRIFDLWLACWTNQEIVTVVNVTEEAIRQQTQEMASLPKLGKSDQFAAEHAVDFDQPIYNIWKQQEKTAGSSHFGNSEVRWLDNLLHLYTEPFDIVVDPFAGGGSTIDICKKRKFLHPGPLNGRGGEFLHISVDHLHLLQVECMARRFHHQPIREAEFSVQNS